MVAPINPPLVLVLRPHHGIAMPTAAFGHLDGLVMRLESAWPPPNYGSLSPLPWYSEDRPPHRSRFRLTAQIDDISTGFYAIRYGYMPSAASDGPFTIEDLNWAGPSLRKLDRRLRAMSAERGGTACLAEIAMRLAIALKVHGICLLEPRAPNAPLNLDHPVRAFVRCAPQHDFAAAIDDLAAQMIATCQARIARAA
jgi:hypothetical protein